MRRDCEGVVETGTGGELVLEERPHIFHGIENAQMEIWRCRPQMPAVGLAEGVGPVPEQVGVQVGEAVLVSAHVLAHAEALYGQAGTGIGGEPLAQPEFGSAGRIASPAASVGHEIDATACGYEPIIPEALVDQPAGFTLCRVERHGIPVTAAQVELQTGHCRGHQGLAGRMTHGTLAEHSRAEVQICRHIRGDAERVDQTDTGAEALCGQSGIAVCIQHHTHVHVRGKGVYTALTVMVKGTYKVPEQVSVNVVVTVGGLLCPDVQALPSDAGAEHRREPLSEIDVQSESGRRVEAADLHVKGVDACRPCDEPVVAEAVLIAIIGSLRIYGRRRKKHR